MKYRTQASKGLMACIVQMSNFYPCARAMKEGANVLILRCTGMTGTAKRLTEELGTPVLEGEGLALALAQLFVDVGLAHSKLAFRYPPKKKRTFPEY